jgi:hypothetical protein
MKETKSNLNANEQKNNIKDDFKKIIVDFCNDILTTFPELNDNLNEDIKMALDGSIESIDALYSHCKQVYPERFFDILYQNQDIFDKSKSSEINTEFLPGVEFKSLWYDDISDNTRATIWKYLQLILFTVIGDMTDSNGFGDTAKLFEAINENEFKSKLEETIEGMKGFFDASGVNVDDPSGINLDGLPSAEQMHSHISGMMEGKIGRLAREIAEETAAELNIDMESTNNATAGEMFQKLFKNPGKLMNLAQSVGNKLDKKIKSGELKESELFEEANELLQKMKSMPGMGNIQNMLGKMGIPNLGGKNTKINVNAMQAQLDRNLKMAKQRDRMRQKYSDKQSQNGNDMRDPPISVIDKEQLEKEATIRKILESGEDGDIENLIFSTGEKVEKSVRPQPSDKSNKKKNKKNKNK